jgi:hypothetical protein
VKGLSHLRELQPRPSHHRANRAALSPLPGSRQLTLLALPRLRPDDCFIDCN